MLKKQTIEIVTPARLHFGFLELNKNINSFGGIGLSIDKFNTKIKLKKNLRLKCKGKYTDKASFFLKTFCKKMKIKPNFLLNIEQCSSKHIGLGSGTQLALSIGTAIAKLENKTVNPEKIAKILNRGLRSKVGLISFIHGGFLIDLKTRNKFFNDIGKVFFPENWKIILIKDKIQGMHGKSEINAFKKASSFNTKNIKMTDLILQKIYPSLIENNFSEFAKTITKIQNIMGKYFNSFQGGIYSSNRVGKVLNFLKKENVLGFGQTSWGPSGFAFFPNIKKAKKMKQKLKKRFSSCNNLEFIICSGKNSGADIQIK